MKLFWRKKIPYHYYWVSYNLKRDNYSGTGACEISISPGKVRTVSDVGLMATWVNNKFFNDKATIVITNFIYLRTEKKEEAVCLKPSKE